jgi:ABC-type multidrug transport system fused ATPase/permease subunit
VTNKTSSTNLVDSQRAIKKVRPKAVDQIATIIFLNAIFFFALAGCFSFVAVALTGSVVVSKTDFLQILIGPIIFFLFIAIFLAILAREFRALKRWTYCWVEFLGTWSTLRAFRVFKDIHRNEVKKIFGITDETDSEKIDISDVPNEHNTKKKRKVRHKQ